MVASNQIGVVVAGKKLTKRMIDAMKPGELLWDGDTKGFGCRCQRRDKVFILKYRYFGRQRWVVIGLHGSPWTVETARAKAKELLGQVAGRQDPARERDAPNRNMTVAELCRLYLSEAPTLINKRLGRAKKPTTLEIDRGRVDRHIIPLIGDRKASEVTEQMVEDLQSDILTGATAADIKTGKRGRAIVRGGPVAAARVVDLLGGIYTYAQRRGIVDFNPVRGVARLRSQKRERHLTAEELGRLGDTLEKFEKMEANPFGIAAIRLLALSGMRRTEVLSLKWSDIDFERGVVNLGESKTGPRAVLIGAPALELLKSIPRLAGSAFVLPATKGSGHYVGLPKFWEKIRGEAKLPGVRLHDLRHGFASTAIASGQTLYVAGKLLGHAHARTTERYAHLADDPLRRAADRVASTISAQMAGKMPGKLVKFRKEK